MMKKIKIFIAYVSCIIAGLSSCSDEDIKEIPVEFTPVHIICGDSTKIVQYVNNVYTFLPDGYNRFDENTSMLASSTDEAVHAVVGSGMQRWGEGGWSPADLLDNPLNKCYTGIRRSFIFEEEILPLVDNNVMGEFGKKLCLGQIYFLRAYYNLEILKRFGGYPLVKTVLTTSDDLNIPRSTYDECVDYIVDLCGQAAELLPITYATNQLGRATKGAALALKARTLLYAASPLFNDPTQVDDTFEHGKYDASKWEKAAEAAAAVIKLNTYGLYTDGKGYEDFFYTLDKNNEIILSRMCAAHNDVERLNGPVSITNGEGGTCPSLNLVNDYEMIDGKAFDWNNPEHAANPFANRDPRFEKSILYNGSTWMNNMVVETFTGGKDFTGVKATRTGFYIRKFCNISASWNAPIGKAFHCFPLLRYGDLLLMYAEAMNEAYGPDTDSKGYGLTARQAVALIRERAGLTGNIDLSETVPAGNREKMRIAIQHERRIELAFEEHRHLDLRRWKLAEQVLNQPVLGLKIDKKEDGTFTYTPQVVESREFTPKMYLYPFPQSEMSRNTNLKQNTGWNS
ncbi:RagB/SusD family nutrient uptake outer membrane protein [Parabacteroides merdae]|jgi:hypothetical protein|uniref:RagB/SusD family nutrient uptake outer membrane protein n=2 Tax=Parabacteroides merdae TaxID=46503 RepID=A0A3R6A573_9BACT|nr:RagB/SusD family nutrient uptake outer membrane protein [Parabacteroides merdae]MTU27835.1 RagB/SusD family nutrient uptake outer membrane protein [Parabacteroides merdae]RGN52932.1 RagB/SusD family nutrient uptake outer membrane protein [Parabacteroides merdae]RGT04885.1 RagB/SusD family nutrient uptake outer membrane protein [Parabacteroides merdae]RYS85844.1 RagB/SusD family nutrient uptake outer membrane protein [Parabacteroides merdae]